MILGASDSTAPYHWAMWGLVVIIVGYLFFRPKRRFPIERHTWLRCKPGTWIRRQIDVEEHGVRSKEFLVQTLKSIKGHRYQLEESLTAEGKAPDVILTERENSVDVDHVPVNLLGRSYECTVWASRQITRGVRTRIRMFIPEGQYEPVGIHIDGSRSEGKLMAVGDTEEVAALGRTFLCTRLEGDVRYGDKSGRMTVWHSPEVPGSEIRSRIVLRDASGESVQNIELVKVHEVK